MSPTPPPASPYLAPDLAFGLTQPHRPPAGKGFRLSSVYIPTRDGARLAADIYLPRILPTGGKVPVILFQTRYWRAAELRPPFRWLMTAPDPVRDFLTAFGYALVRLDVRGTGASSGQWRFPWSQDEVADMRDVVDWIVAQPWCSGQVGAYGNSYAGTTAEFLATLEHPAVRAVMPRFNEFDVYSDIGFPGGLPLEGFNRDWSALNQALDENRHPPGTPLLQRILASGVRPVDTDRDRCLLATALQDHRGNLQVSLLLGQVDSRDQRAPRTSASVDEMSICSYLPAIARSATAIESWGGWMDAGTADAVIRRFLNYPTLQRGVIGPWNHGGAHHASPYFNGPNPFSIRAHMIEMLRFFDRHLLGLESDLPRGKALVYYTLGEERWKTTSAWPPPGVAPRRWYLAGALSLRVETQNLAPLPSSPPDTYAVDFSASTGQNNRWQTEMDGRPVRYGDRAEADRRLLAYTSPPLERDLEITGYPVVTLYLASTHPDGTLLVYLEEVAPSGAVTYLTEGGLRLLHRKLGQAAPPYQMQVPYHSFKLADRQPMLPGEVAELRFALQPISIRLPAGHCLRIAIAGADAGTFSRLPESGDPLLSVYHDSQYPSYIELPIMP